MSCPDASSNYLLRDLIYISRQGSLLELFLSWGSWRIKVGGFFPPWGSLTQGGAAVLGRGVSNNHHEKHSD